MLGRLVLKTTFRMEPIHHKTLYSLIIRINSMMLKKGETREHVIMIIIYLIVFALLLYLGYKFTYGSGLSSLSIE